MVHKYTVSESSHKWAKNWNICCFLGIFSAEIFVIYVHTVPWELLCIKAEQRDVSHQLDSYTWLHHIGIWRRISGWMCNKHKHKHILYIIQRAASSRDSTRVSESSSICSISARIFIFVNLTKKSFIFPQMDFEQTVKRAYILKYSSFFEMRVHLRKKTHSLTELFCHPSTIIIAIWIVKFHEKLNIYQFVTRKIVWKTTKTLEHFLNG